MKRGLKLAEAGTASGPILTPTTRLAVQDYWRKLGYPVALRGGRARSITNSSDRAKIRRRRKPRDGDRLLHER